MKRIAVGIALILCCAYAKAEAPNCVQIMDFAQSIAQARDDGVPAWKVHQVVQQMGLPGKMFVDAIYADTSKTPAQVQEAAFKGCWSNLRAGR